MGFLNFLLGSKESEKPTAAQPVVTSAIKSTVSFTERFIRIPSIGLFSPFKKSKSGEWIICCSDSDGQGRGGHRESGHGRYVLYNLREDKVVLQGKLERPYSGGVADTGIFSVEDKHFGSDSSGTFYVFSPAGDQLIKHKLEANIFNSDISDSGRFAICQTANARLGEDGNRLVAFDVEKKIKLFSVHPTTGWADSYKFIEETSHFAVVIDKVGTFHYDVDGNFVDAKKYEAARLRCNEFNVVLLAAEEILKEPDINKQRAEVALEATLRARSLGADSDQYWKAMALKIQGLAYEALNSDEEALLAFDEAMKMSPKIGVKRKADALRKKLKDRAT